MSGFIVKRQVALGTDFAVSAAWIPGSLFVAALWTAKGGLEPFGSWSGRWDSITFGHVAYLGKPLRDRHEAFG